MSDPVRPEDVEAIVAAFQGSDCTDLHIRFEGFELHLSTDAASPPLIRRETAPSTPRLSNASTPAANIAKLEVEDLAGLEVVCAPYLGTFYRAPKPGDAAYVEVGSLVGPDTDLCLIEVMKLFTAVRAGVNGTVARILVTDGAMVAAGQALFAIAEAT